MFVLRAEELVAGVPTLAPEPAFLSRMNVDVKIKVQARYYALVIKSRRAKKKIESKPDQRQQQQSISPRREFLFFSKIYFKTGDKTCCIRATRAIFFYCFECGANDVSKPQFHGQQKVTLSGPRTSLFVGFWLLLKKFLLSAVKQIILLYRRLVSGGTPCDILYEV